MSAAQPKPPPQPSIAEIVRENEPELLTLYSRHDLREMARIWCKRIIIAGKMRNAEAQE